MFVVFVFLRQGLAWKLLCRLGWPQIHRKPLPLPFPECWDLRHIAPLPALSGYLMESYPAGILPVDREASCFQASLLSLGPKPDQGQPLEQPAGCLWMHSPRLAETFPGRSTYTSHSVTPEMPSPGHQALLTDNEVCQVLW